MRIVLRSETPDDTRAVGEALAPLLRGGDVLALTGELGAGKTTLVQGIARGLGAGTPVLSPTFTLVREYAGSVPIYHVDVYRLDRVQDVLDLGFEEMLGTDGVTIVEWGDAIEALLPESRLRIELTTSDDLEVRRLALSGRGPAWAIRWERLERATERWGSSP